MQLLLTNMKVVSIFSSNEKVYFLKCGTIPLEDDGAFCTAVGPGSSLSRVDSQKEEKDGCVWRRTEATRGHRAGHVPWRSSGTSTCGGHFCCGFVGKTADKLDSNVNSSHADNAGLDGLAVNFWGQWSGSCWHIWKEHPFWKCFHTHFVFQAHFPCMCQCCIFFSCGLHLCIDWNPVRKDCFNDA